MSSVYIDFKIEFGFDRETRDLRVADVDMSKQSYRDGTATLPESESVLPWR